MSPPFWLQVSSSSSPQAELQAKPRPDGWPNQAAKAWPAWKTRSGQRQACAAWELSAKELMPRPAGYQGQVLRLLCVFARATFSSNPNPGVTTPATPRSGMWVLRSPFSSESAIKIKQTPQPIITSESRNDTATHLNRGDISVEAFSLYLTARQIRIFCFF